jgi:TfoX/Sxy family transcriptional regulator of competence genes
MADVPDATRRSMFGCPVYFIGEYMAVGAHQETLILRLPDADVEALLASEPEATSFMPMPGRAMRGYVAFSMALADDDARLTPWLVKALAHVRGLPPKPPKAPRAGARKG